MHDVVEPQLEGNEDGKRSLSISKSSCLILLMKIHDMIDYFTIKGQTFVPKQNAFSINSLMSDLKSIFELNAEQRNITLHTEFSDRLLPTEVNTDLDRLKQILANLITNAIKFTESGGKVLIQAEAALDYHFVIKVIDTGVGIAKNL